MKPYHQDDKTTEIEERYCVECSQLIPPERVKQAKVCSGKCAAERKRRRMREYMPEYMREYRQRPEVKYDHRR